MRRPLALVVLTAGLLLAPPALAHLYTTAPLTGATDFITGLPSSYNVGPVGVVFDGDHVFVADFAALGIYVFPLSGGPAANATAFLQNGINAGLAKAEGQYLGMAHSPPTFLTPGLYQWDPDTLQVVRQVWTSPCGVNDRAVVEDPLSTDLYVSNECGIFRLTGWETGPAASEQLASGNFDGLTFSADGQRLYAASFDTHARAYDRNFTVVMDVPVQGTIDGIAVITAGTRAPDGTDLSGDIVVNNNDGSMELIDVQHGSAITQIAAGGSRGDFVTVGPDGCLYATQTDMIEKLAPCVFETPKPRPSVLRVETILASATIPGTIVVNAPPRVAAHLLADDGAPIVGRVVNFSTSQGALCAATTDADGLAECTDLSSQLGATLALGVQASFAGDATWLASAGQGNLLVVNGTPLP